MLKINNGSSSAFQEPPYKESSSHMNDRYRDIESSNLFSWQNRYILKISRAKDLDI